MNVNDMFKQSCWNHCSFIIGRYLMSNAEGRWDGVEKALRHMELCKFYVSVARQIEIDKVDICEDELYLKIHEYTAEKLTNRLDETIGFPIQGRPDYDNLEPLFFKKFHTLAMIVIKEMMNEDKYEVV